MIAVQIAVLVALGAGPADNPLAAGAHIPNNGVAFDALRGTSTNAYTTTAGRLKIAIRATGDPKQPAQWVAVDGDGRVAWTARHSCPNFGDLPALIGGEEIAACKLNRSIIGVDAKTGREVWRWESPTRLFITAGAQGRIASSVDNRELAVLDQRSGQVLQRWAVDGSPLEAVAATPKGPLALLILEPPPDGTERFMELEVDGEVMRAQLTGVRDDREIGGIPIGGATFRGVRPMILRFAAPFAGYSYEITPSGGAAVGLPRQGVQVAIDMATSEQLWARKVSDTDERSFGPSGGLWIRREANGAATFGAARTRDLGELWTARWPAGRGRLSWIGEDGGFVVVLSDQAWEVRRFEDGARVEDGSLATGWAPQFAEVDQRGALWITRQADRWRLHYTAFTRDLRVK